MKYRSGASISEKSPAQCAVRLGRVWQRHARNTAAHAETAVPPKPENETRALSEPAFADRFVSLAVQCQLRYTTKLRKSRVNLHYQNGKNASNISVLSRGGEGGIRTHGADTRTTVFKCAGRHTSQYPLALQGT